MNEVVVENLSLQIRRRQILTSVNAKMSSNHVTGIVGNNGSGKSMLLKCICGFITPTNGSVTVRLDGDVSKGGFPASMGFIIESPGFLGEMSGIDNLWFLARIRNRISREAARDSMIKVGLDPDDPKQVRKYSMGMKQRLGIAQAIMEDPLLLVLDEPMNGLDRQGIREMRELFRELSAQGKMLILTSHDPEDIKELCAVVYQMDSGRLELLADL